MFPHYKFNLTNGSENLETMEYMKCGRVYHGGRRGVVPTAILSGPIHILRKRDDERATGGRGTESGSRSKCRGPGDANGKTCCRHDKKSRGEVDARFLSHSKSVARMPSRDISSFVSSDPTGENGSRNMIVGILSRRSLASKKPGAMMRQAEMRNKLARVLRTLKFTRPRKQT